MSKKKLKNLIKKILLEVSIIDNNYVTIDNIKETGNDFINSNINVDFLNNIIKNILEGKPSKWTLDFANARKKIKEFNYITSTVVSFYNKSNNSIKENIKNYIFHALLPKGRNSIFLTLIGKKAGIVDIFRKNREDEIFDLLLNSVVESIPKALEEFNPEKKRDFFAFVTLIGTQLAINTMKDWYSSVSGGETEYIKKSSLDEPLDDEKEETHASMLPSEENYEADISELSQAVDNFIRNKVLKGKSSLWLDIYDMSVSGYNTLQMADDLEQDARNIRVIRNRMAIEIDNAIKNGELSEYVLEKTGYNINNFPKIKEILKGGKFLFSTPTSIIKEMLKKISENRILLK